MTRGSLLAVGLAYLAIGAAGCARAELVLARPSACEAGDQGCQDPSGACGADWAGDADCQHPSGVTSRGEGTGFDVTCADGRDNDCNGLTDAEEPACAKTLYRSVGVNVSDLNRDGRSIELEGDRAVFSGPMPDNVGVGDVLEYEIAAVPRLPFISRRESAAVYGVQDAAGGAPASCPAGTAVRVYRAYISLAAWASLTENLSIAAGARDFDGSKDLQAQGARLNVACYADGPDTTTVVIEGWTTTPTNYIRIYAPTASFQVGVSQRHQGVWSNNAYRMEHVGSGCAIKNTVDYLRIEGLQVLSTTSVDVSCGISSAQTRGEMQVTANIIRDTTANDIDEYHGFKIYYATPGTPVIKLWNNVIYDFNYPGSTKFQSAIYINPASTRGYIYNNTLLNCVNGILGRLASTIIKNNLVNGCYGGYTSWNGDHAASDNNVSDDSVKAFPGSRSVNGASGAVGFVDLVSRNLHLAATDTVARDRGVDLSTDADLAFSRDLDGQCRQGTWDVGADEAD